MGTNEISHRKIWFVGTLWLASVGAVPACSLLAPSDAELMAGDHAAGGDGAVTTEDAPETENPSQADVVGAPDVTEETAQAQKDSSPRDSMTPQDSRMCAQAGQSCGAMVVCCSGTCKPDRTCR
jgi:hypothetical protein